MKKVRKYTRKKKIWALLLFILFMGLTVAGGIGLYYVNNFGSYLFSKTELLQTGRFENTETLERKIMEDTDRIFRYAGLSQMFGETDEENLQVPLYIARINGTEYALCLKDLENIYETLYGQEYEVELEYDTEYSMDQTTSSSESEILYGSGSTSAVAGDQAAEDSLQQEYHDYLDQFAGLYAQYYGAEAEDGEDLEEEWRNLSNEEKEAEIKARGWEDHFGSVWFTRVPLESTAEILVYPGQQITLTYEYYYREDVRERTDFATLYVRGQELLQDYYDLKNQLDEDETNLRYVIYDEEAGIFEANSSVREESELQNMEKYVSYDSRTHGIQSNFTKTDLEYWQLDNLSRSLPGTETGVSFTVGLDTRYLVQDEYKSMSEGYVLCRPVLILSLFAILLGMLGGIPTFIYLLASVGHREDRDEISLDKFDQWPTELAAALIIGGIYFFIMACSFLAAVFAENFFTSSLIYTVMQCIAIIVSAIIGLIGFFSLIKRLKAGTVWKNSLTRRLLRKIGRGCRLFVKNWPVTGKMTGAIILYWVLTIPLCMFITINRFWGSSFLYVTGILLFSGIQLGTAGLLLWTTIKRKKILEGVERISSGDLDYVIDDEGMLASDKKLADCINHIGTGLQDAVDTAVKSERMKADLITNVSHDIKTPLTSIINYVDLMKRENIEDETLKHYLDILDQKSQRLKTLTEDLVEASRASSGNINLHMERINYVELVRQTCGEFNEKFQERNLIQVTSFPEDPLYVIADGRRVWRILENLFSNTRKYAMPGTRVYVSVSKEGDKARFIMKNISESELNISGEELTERFTRGDTSRSTEGSGLGLSIAKSFTELQGGRFDIYLNGDLFQVSVEFSLAPEEKPAGPGKDGDQEEKEAAPGTEAGEEQRKSGRISKKEKKARRMAEARFLQEALEELESSGLLEKRKRRLK